jgi:hypothetical protein
VRLVSNVNYTKIIFFKHRLQYLFTLSSETNYSYLESLEIFNISTEIEVREIQVTIP